MIWNPARWWRVECDKAEYAQLQRENRMVREIPGHTTAHTAIEMVRIGDRMRELADRITKNGGCVK